MSVRINGKEAAARLQQEMKAEVGELIAQGITPGLAVVMVGDDAGSKVYVRNKQRACDALGIYSEQYLLPAETGQQELMDLVERLNSDPKIHGILVQSPLPAHLDEGMVVRAISPDKDVDAFHPQNVGEILLGKHRFLPCTPAGVMHLLHLYQIPVEGKNCVVIGRSNIVGKPMALLLLHENATVTVCHSRTRDLADITRKADLIVVAVGRAGFLTGDMVKEGAVIIDVGMNRNEAGKLCGDVDFASVEPKASYITPVPGGVGPMTITMLMHNTLTAAKIAQK